MRLIADSSLVNWFIAVAPKTDSMTETMADENKTQYLSFKLYSDKKQSFQWIKILNIFLG